MKSISLCIPAYNAAGYLPRLLASANAQHLPFKEILVYDDHSTDGTATVARAFGATVISGQVNKGCSFGKNKLAEVATGDWLHFHDADDDLHPNFTDEANNWIQANGQRYDVLLLNFEYIDALSGTLLGTAGHNVTALRADPLQYAIMHKIVNFGLYERAAFLKAGSFDLQPEVLFNEDNALHQQLAKAGLRFDYLPVSTCINYRYAKSMSASNRRSCARSNYYVLAKTAQSHGRAYPAELSAQLWNCISILAAEQDWNYVKKALALIRELGGSGPASGSRLYKSMAAVHPFGAAWFREQMIRLFKPAYRKF